MSRIKITVMALFTVVALTAMVASSASAAGWHVNGTELGKGSKQALTTAATVDTDATLSIVSKSEIVQIKCTGTTLNGTSPEIIGTNEGMAKALTFTGCATTKPATKCALEKSEVKTNPIKVFVTKGSGEADVATFDPLSEEPFASIPFSEKNTCAFTEGEPVNGSVRVNAPTGQTEQELQAIEGQGSFENNSLEVAGDKSYIEGGKALLKLASGSKWSFR